jgi:hypothetical protein
MSWFDKALDWFKDRFQRDAQHRLAHFIPSGEAAIVADEHYFQLWLDEMFLTDERNWFADWHPAVHSAVTFSFGDQEQAITRIAGASSLKDVDQSHLNRVITLSTQLTGLMPFKGDSIRINAALLAMKGNDSVKQLIDVLGDFSTKLAVPQLSLALDFAKPLAQGVSALVGVTDGEMLLGVDVTLAGKALRPGSYAIVYATEAEMPKAGFSIDAGELHFQGKHLTGRNYMLLRIESADKRDDFNSLSAIRDPYQQAVDMLTDGQLESSQKLLKKAIGAALKSNDLTETDRTRVIDVLKKRYNNAQNMIGSGAFAEPASRTLDALMEEAITPEEAAALGRFNERTAMAGLQ